MNFSKIKQHNLQKNVSKKTKIFYIYLLAATFFCLLLIFIQHFQTKKSISNFFKNQQINSLDLKYKNVSNPLFGDGLIFYKVTFPKLAIDHFVEKMIVKQQSDFIHIRMINTHIDVINSLRKNNNIHIINKLHDYNPITDSFQKPLQSLALSNIDEIKLNISLIIKPKGDSLIVYGQIENPQLIDIDFKVRINPTQTKNEGLFYAFYASATPLSVSIKNNGLFERYDSYLLSLGLDEKSPKRSLLKKKIIRFLNGDLTDLDLTPAFKTSAINKTY